MENERRVPNNLVWAIAVELIFDSPAKVVRRARQIRYLISHLPQHWDHRRVLRDARQSGVASRDMLLDFKYLGSYLAEQLSAERRRAAIAFHYTFLKHSITSFGKRQLWNDGISIWHQYGDSREQDLVIRLERATLAPMEGEAQLRFLLGNLTLCTLTFCFLDGASIGLPSDAVLLIGGLQGAANRRREIRMAAKANGEIAPAASLILAAKAIAMAFRVQYVVGVSTERHIAWGYAREKISLSYDDMWLKAGGTRVDEGFFVLAPGMEKPLKDIPISHRPRTRRKRILQGELQDAVLLSVQGTLRATEPSQNELLTAGGMGQTNSRELERLASGYWRNVGSRCLPEVRAFASSILASRGPILPKLIFAAGLVYPFGPLDIIPDSHLDEVFSIISGLVGSWLLMNSNRRKTSQGNGRV
jgi:uncharacterized protein VirK/YbjX